MNFVLEDNNTFWENLLPLTYTRSIADCRVGILTIKEKWEKYLGCPVQIKTKDYLQEKYGTISEDNSIRIHSAVLPTKLLVQQIKSLAFGTGFKKENLEIAFNGKNASEINWIEYPENIDFISFPWHIFQKNAQEIAADFSLLTENKTSEPIDKSNTILGDASRIFLEKGAIVQASILNPADGYIYLGADAEIMEGSVIRGSLALCTHAQTKLATKIYGATTVGPYSKVGGEVNNSVIFGYSNKGHDGFLGNSVLGEWCNLGADTNNSNLKNNYGDISYWSYAQEKEIKTGLQFCGLIMGDHSKSGINTMFNTGTVCGVSSNIFGANFPKKHIPSFSWGGAEKTETFEIEKAFEVAHRMMERRNIPLTEMDKRILQHIFSVTKKYRNDAA